MAGMRTKKRTAETLDGKTVLVLGGAGFIGSNFIRLLLSRHPHIRIVNFDKLTYSGNPANLRDVAKDARYAFVKGDIADSRKISAVLKKYAPEYVINFAAETHVDRSIHGGAEEFVRTNVLGTAVLMQALSALPNLHKFVQVSTDEVYGSLPLSSKKRFTEISPLSPSSPYSSSKAAADLIVLSYQKTYGIPAVVTRCSNNYGPYQHPEKLIPFSVSRLLSGQSLTIYGDGQYVRDWIHVEDHSAALESALIRGVPGEVYNIGASDEVSNLEIARYLVAHFGKDHTHIEFVADRPGHDRRYAIDSTKAQNELLWRPQHRAEHSFAAVVAWYIDNQPWLRQALSRGGVPNTHIRPSATRK